MTSARLEPLVKDFWEISRIWRGHDNFSADLTFEGITKRLRPLVLQDVYPTLRTQATDLVNLTVRWKGSRDPIQGEVIQFPVTQIVGQETKAA